MTLMEIIRLISGVALTQPSVKTVVSNDVFRLNAMPDARYGVFAYLQGNHTSSVDSDEDIFRFTFFYVDRLTEDGSNEIEVQSVGKATLDNILRKLSETVGVESWDTTTFNQRFNDMCAGVFCSVSLSVPVNSVCAHDYAVMIL